MDLTDSDQDYDQDDSDYDYTGEESATDDVIEDEEEDEEEEERCRFNWHDEDEDSTERGNKIEKKSVEFSTLCLSTLFFPILTASLKYWLQEIERYLRGCPV